MPTLDELLARPGLAAGDRVLIAAAAAIAPGDWTRLGAAVDAARERALAARAELEETLLQGVLFFGFPRIVTAFETLQRLWPAPAPPRGGGLPAGEQSAAGKALFAAIYGANAEPVAAMLRDYHGELHDFVLEAAYGRILTRPALSPLRRELLATGALAALDQPRQLIAHARGALQFGAEAASVGEAMFTAVPDMQRVEAWLERIVRSR